jgi:hypothetical protein
MTSERLAYLSQFVNNIGIKPYLPLKLFLISKIYFKAGKQVTFKKDSGCYWYFK